MNEDTKHNKGFTLIELLVAMAAAMLLMTGVYAAYRTHTRTQITQGSVVDLLQSMRSAMAVMEREIRMAAYDPTGEAEARVLVADVGELAFEVDLNDDGNPNPTPGTDPNERIRFALTNDADRDGRADALPCGLGREVWNGGLQTMIPNVEALNFVYLDGSDPPQPIPTPVADPDSIRAVQVTLVARSEEELPASFIRYRDNSNYLNQFGQVVLPAPNDDFRRVRLTSEIKCRNLAFEPF